MKTFEEIFIEIEQRKQMFHWFIDGIGKHGISWKMYDYLTPEYVEKCYNWKPVNYNEDLVDAACCIGTNNKTWDGKRLFDIETRFYGWIKVFVKNKLNII